MKHMTLLYDCGRGGLAVVWQTSIRAVCCHVALERIPKSQIYAVSFGSILSLRVHGDARVSTRGALLYSACGAEITKCYTDY